MRTVGNWERGHTVPRNRLAAINELLGLSELPVEPVGSTDLGPRLANVERQIDQLWQHVERLENPTAPSHAAPCGPRIAPVPDPDPLNDPEGMQFGA